jgi:hypothetical protein
VDSRPKPAVCHIIDAVPVFRQSAENVIAHAAAFLRILAIGRGAPKECVGLGFHGFTGRRRSSEFDTALFGLTFSALGGEVSLSYSTQEFGSAHTHKLGAVQSYLSAFTTALKRS